MVWLSQPTQSPHLLSRFHLAQCGTVHLPGNSDRRKQQNTHDLFAGFALNFIRRHQREPFFLYVPFTAPHDDIEIPDMAPYADQSWTEEEKVYAAMITRMDRDIGTILSLLQELSLDERTIVFFCSDNGAANRYEHLFKNSGLLTGRKRDMTEGGIRTPMVVRWPGKVPAAQVSEQPWTLADFFATATDLADAPSPPANDARGILPTLLGEAQPELTDRFLYWEFYEKGFQQAVRWQTWKVIRSIVGGRLVLHDLRADHAETTNVAGSHPELIAKFESYLKTARRPSQEWPATIDSKVSSQRQIPQNPLITLLEYYLQHPACHCRGSFSQPHGSWTPKKTMPL